MTERYPNNSIVSNTDIGTGSAALVCTTTLPGCCFSGHRETQWYFPNGSQVPNNPYLPYQRTRGQNPGRVILSRNSESTTTGIFRCDIPDARDLTQSLYVGIYDSGTGESCTLSSINGYLQGHIYQSRQGQHISRVLCVLYIIMALLMKVE